MGGVSVFGRPSSSGIASAVLNSPALNANPSPTTPQSVPSDQRASAYSRLLAACYEVKKVETDPFKLAEVQKCEAFADSQYREIVEGEMSGPPGSFVVPPAPPAPMAPPQQAGPTAQPPGMPSAPSPGGPMPQAPGSA